MMTALDRLAAAYGIELSYVSETGEHRVISDDVKRDVLSTMGIDAGDALDVDGDGKRRGALAADDELGTPASCFVPGWLAGNRGWGVNVQLYGLRSRRNHGIGDFEDLAQLAELLARTGADFIGVSPLHALFPGDAERCSPYSASSRAYLNPLFIALDRVLGADDVLGRIPSEIVDGLRAPPFVDYTGVAALKRKALEHLFAARGADSDAFAAYCQEAGESLDRFVLFEALSETLPDGGSGWTRWPPSFQAVDSADAQAFKHKHADRLHFHKWMQWTAATQLDDVQRRARSAGMRIGLYLDLAVGVAPDGAATWSDPDLVAVRARVGAPPDLFNTGGQDWGLAPMAPAALATRDYAPFRRDVVALMRSAGAIRIDHAMGLRRFYWIPVGFPARHGAYVHYPMNALLRELSRCSHDANCLVVGEDLGTVPAGFRETMRAQEIMGTRVLFFERLHDGQYAPPASYPREALACLSTHDLPTLRGWWRGTDIEARRDLGLYSSELADAAIEERQRSRLLMLGALCDEGLVGGELADSAVSGAGVPDALPDEVFIALHRFMARTPCRLLALQIEDLAGADYQVNLPGTDRQYPNWRRKLDIMIEDLPNAALFTRTLEVVADERPRAAFAAEVAAELRATSAR